MHHPVNGSQDGPVAEVSGTPVPAAGRPAKPRQDAGRLALILPFTTTEGPPAGSNARGVLSSRISRFPEDGRRESHLFKAGAPQARCGISGLKVDWLLPVSWIREIKGSHPGPLPSTDLTGELMILDPPKELHIGYSSSASVFECRGVTPILW